MVSQEEEEEESQEPTFEEFLYPVRRYRDRLAIVSKPTHVSNNSATTTTISTGNELQVTDQVTGAVLSKILAYTHAVDKIIWLNDAAFCKTCASATDDLVANRMLCLTDQYRGHKWYVFADSTDAAQLAMNSLWHMASTWDKPDLTLKRLSSSRRQHGLEPGSGGCSLRQFLQQTSDRLRKLTLEGWTLGRDHCRAFTVAANAQVEVKLFACTVGPDASDVFMDWMQSTAGPTVLFRCDFASSHVLADGIANNSRLKKLVLSSECLLQGGGSTASTVAAFSQGLAQNTSLVKLYMGRQTISENDWNGMCKALQPHPTLVALDLTGTRQHNRGQPAADISVYECRKRRTMAIAKMLESNTVLHTIQLAESALDQDLFDKKVTPCLELNLYWPRVRTVQQSPSRLGVLGRAVGKVGPHHPNRLWMILSGNVDILANIENNS